jgi:formylglycine-generating enzyme required for sulfatase activity
MIKHLIFFGMILSLSAITFAQSQKNPLPEIKDENCDIILVEIPAGSLTTEADYEAPAMVVRFEGFYLGKYEITQKQWESVMGYNPSEIKGDDLPVTHITWHWALDFVKKLTRKTGHIYRLPTALEWEYACRAGTTSDYYFGTDVSHLKEYEWYKENSGGKPHPVGQKKPNPWGLYDMTGNANEWTATYWDPEPFYRTHPDDERTFWGIYRIVKGSSFLHGRDAHFRSNYAHAYSQYQARKYLGFRVLREK